MRAIRMKYNHTYVCVNIYIYIRTLCYRYTIYIIYIYVHTYNYRKKFRSQTIWTDEKAEVGGEEKWRSEKRKSQRKEDAGARKGSKVPKHCVFPMVCGSGGSTSRLAKAAGAEPSGQMRDEKLHAVVARSTFRSQKCQKVTVSDDFWKLRCRKSAHRCGAKQISKSKCTKHTILGALLEVEMSKKCTPLWREAQFPSQNVQNTPGSEHFWNLRCRKSVRCCGTKHISKSKCTKHARVGALLEVEMSKKCTLLWREAHFEVKSLKNWRSRSTFASWDVEKCTPLWREAHFQVKMLKAPHVRTTFESSDVVLRGWCEGFCTMPKVSKTWRVL